MKTAIYGAGSLGTVLGAYLSKAGVDVDLITRNKEHVDAMNKGGAKIIGTVNMTVPVHALTPDQMTEKYELIILLTKQLDNENILRNLEKNMTDDCIVCTLQNGLPELSVSKVVGEDRTMGCTVAWGATLHGKGVSELTSEPDSMSFGLGRMNGQKDEKLMQVKALLEKMCPVEIEDNFMGVRWSKLLINSAFSGMSAVIGGTFGDAAENKESRVCCQNIIKECIDVANAAGIRIEPVQVRTLSSFFIIKATESRRRFPLHLFRFASRSTDFSRQVCFRILKKADFAKSTQSTALYANTAGSTVSRPRITIRSARLFTASSRASISAALIT